MLAELSKIKDDEIMVRAFASHQCVPKRVQLDVEWRLNSMISLRFSNGFLRDFLKSRTNKQQYIKYRLSQSQTDLDIELRRTTYVDPSNVNCFHQNINTYANSTKFLDK